MPGAECMLLSNAGIFLRTAKSLTNSYGVAVIEDVQPGYYQVNVQNDDTGLFKRYIFKVRAGSRSGEY